MGATHCGSIRPHESSIRLPILTFSTFRSSWFYNGCNNKHREKCRNACRGWVKSLSQSNKDSPIFHTYSGDRTIYSKLDCDKAASFSSDRWMKNHLPKHCLDDVCWNELQLVAPNREPSISGYSSGYSNTNSGSGGFAGIQ